VSQKALGQAGELSLTYSQGERIGAVLSGLGINLNLAPVVDLAINPESPAIAKKERSFSQDPGQVAAHAQEVIRGHHAHHVLTTLKHFPGHGSAALDTHEGFVDVTTTWSEDELDPYRLLIQGGEVDAIMTAHVFNKDLDPEYPCSLSFPVLTGILRQRLGFEGVIISDDLQMGAISLHYPLEAAVRLALQAGSDILLFANQQTYDPQIAPKVIAIVKHLVETGEVSQERINQSFARIASLKGVSLQVLTKLR